MVAPALIFRFSETARDLLGPPNRGFSMHARTWKEEQVKWIGEKKEEKAGIGPPYESGSAPFLLATREPPPFSD